MQRIEFLHHFSDKNGNKIDPSAIGLPPGIPECVPHIITLRGLDEGKTEITITESGYRDLQVAEMSRAGMNECLDKMEESIKNVKPVKP